MDTLKLLNKKIEQIKSEEYMIDLSYIIVHISRAEKYFELGREKKEPEYYNDVIYRTNQAYEGGLRCAYKILLEKDHALKSTYQIEEELNKENILNKRVKNMFSIYRNDWRNQSTHHYDFVCDQSEALMAINNVESFIYLLLDQIKEKDSYLYAKLKSKDSKKISFKDFVLQKLVLFPSIFYQSLKNKNEESLTEIELMKGIENYLKKLDSEIEIFSEYPLKTNLHMNRSKVDFYLKKGKEEQYIELKILKNSVAIETIIHHNRERCKIFNMKDLVLFIWDGNGEYEIKENIQEDITIKIITKVK